MHIDGKAYILGNFLIFPKLIDQRTGLPAMVERPDYLGPEELQEIGEAAHEQGRRFREFLERKTDRI